MRRVSFSVLCSSLAVAAACGQGPATFPDLPATPGGSFLAVATSDYSPGGGELHAVNLADPSQHRLIDQRTGDQPVVRAFGSQLFVINQTAGAVRVYDIAADFTGARDYSLGKMPQVPAAQANPYDLYIDAPRNAMYVTLYGSYGSKVVTGTTALAVLDTRNLAAGIQRFIPLPVASGDSDGNPEATRLAGCGDKLYVLLQDLDRGADYAPIGPGRLAVVNLTNPNSVGIIKLAGQNPTGLTVLPGCAEAIVGSAGNQLTGALTGAAGIERVDLASGKTLGLAFTDVDLGGNLSTIDAVDAHAVFVDVSSKNGMSYDNNVYLLDVAARQKSQKILGPLPFVPQLRVVAQNLVVLAAGLPGSGQLRPGLFIGPASGAPLGTTPIDLGMGPISADLYTR